MSRCRLPALASFLCFTVFLAGCDPSASGEGGAERPPSPTSLRPENPELASLYMQSCYSCHATGASRAPRTGMTREWEPRLEQGMELMVQRTVRGYRAMPPMGMCRNCDEEDFEALIRFMAGEEGD